MQYNICYPYLFDAAPRRTYDPHEPPTFLFNYTDNEKTRKITSVMYLYAYFRDDVPALTRPEDFPFQGGDWLFSRFNVHKEKVSIRIDFRVVKLEKKNLEGICKTNFAVAPFITSFQIGTTSLFYVQLFKEEYGIDVDEGDGYWSPKQPVFTKEDYYKFIKIHRAFKNILSFDTENKAALLLDWNAMDNSILWMQTAVFGMMPCDVCGQWKDYDKETTVNLLDKRICSDCFNFVQ